MTQAPVVMTFSVSTVTRLSGMDEASRAEPSFDPACCLRKNERKQWKRRISQPLQVASLPSAVWSTKSLEFTRHSNSNTAFKFKSSTALDQKNKDAACFVSRTNTYEMLSRQTLLEHFIGIHAFQAERSERMDSRVAL
jgi:hypothetical protein